VKISANKEYNLKKKNKFQNFLAVLVIKWFTLNITSQLASLPCSIFLKAKFCVFLGPKNMISTGAKDFRDKNGPNSPHFEK
jgi:hypothetical protein